MKPTNPVQSMPVYASDSAYRKGPSDEQQLAGMVPLDTLPADWWNWLWEQVTIRINSTVSGLESVYDEILSVLADAEIAPSDLQVNQLLTAIKAITQRVGSSGTAGAVKSSSDSGKVAIDANGFMSPNGMGIPSSLNTTAKSIVSAINELLAALNAYKTSNDGAVQALNSGKAPNDHSSAATTYGVATTTKYGHVKLSDTYTQDEAKADVAATQSGLAGAYNALKTMIEMAGGLPTAVAADPIVNLTGNGTNAVEGTVNIATPGFYYIELAGGDGGFGGIGGNGGNGQFGGGGGAGAGLVNSAGTIRTGFDGSVGVLKKGIYFLPSGTYNYKIGGKGTSGTNGGNGAGASGYGGGGGASGVSGDDGYNCQLGFSFKSVVSVRGGGKGEDTSYGYGNGGGGGGGAGGAGGFGGTTEFSGPNIYMRARGGIGAVGCGGGGGGGGKSEGFWVAGDGGAGGSCTVQSGIPLTGFLWVDGSSTGPRTYRAPGAGGTSTGENAGAGGSAGYNWASDTYFGVNPYQTDKAILRYIAEYLAEENYRYKYAGVRYLGTPTPQEGYLKIYPLVQGE